MGASDFTEHLSLPVFSDNDKPTWRGDINYAFNTIDGETLRLSNQHADSVRSAITGMYHADKFSPDGQVTRDSIQAAINAATGTVGDNDDTGAGPGGVVYIREPGDGEPAWFIDGTIFLKTRVTLMGAGRIRRRTSSDAYDYCLRGNGVDPLFSSNGYARYGANGVVANIVVNGVTVPDASNGNVARQISIRNLSASNTNAPVVKFYHSNNFTFDNVHFVSEYDNPVDHTGAVHIRYSYRGQITNSEFGCRNGWCLTVRDNANGVLIDGNVMSGGAGGGAVDYAGSIAGKITRNIIEVSKVGIRVAGAPQQSEGFGNCHSVTVEGNYIEQSAQPLSIGAVSVFRGGKVRHNWMSLPTPDGSAYVPNWAILLGRVQHSDISYNTASRDGSEPFFKLLKQVAGTDGSTIGVRNCRVVGNSSYATPFETFMDTSDYDTTYKRILYGQSIVQTVDGSMANTTREREWVSPTLTANAAQPPTEFFKTDKGGEIRSVEIIDASGALTGCRLDIGHYPTSIVEVASVPNLATLTLENGRASTPVTLPNIRPGESLSYRVVAGTGTGTFRVRVTWQG